MKGLDSLLFLLIVATTWAGGIALAGRPLSTIAAIFFPPWAFYLFVERIMSMLGILP